MNAVHQPPTGKTLDAMFELQKAILKQYIALEDLPQYPIELHTRKGQKVLKDFAYRFIEELGEAYEVLALGYGAVSTNHTEEAQEYIRLYNEELADAWHFMVELLLYSGVGPDEIRQWMYRYGKDHEEFGNLMSRESILGGLLPFAEFKNNMDHKNPGAIRNRDMFVIWPGPEVFTDTPQNLGGRKLSAKEVEVHAEFLWFCTYNITSAMNCLKTREWHKEDERPVNSIKYHETLLEAFISFIRLMSFTGQTELGIYNSYILKNEINWQKIKNR